MQYRFPVHAELCILFLCGFRGEFVSRTGRSMSVKPPPIHERVVLERKDLQSLFDALHQRKYDLIGPVVHDGAIVYDEFSKVDELPAGRADEQEAATYRLKKTDEPWLFRYTVGPHSWKKFLHPPQLRLWQMHGTGRNLEIDAPVEKPRSLAFIGVRSCDLHAIAVLDKVCIGGPYVDPGYAARRASCFIVAVNCVKAGGTCFCASMNTGPKAEHGFDIALTEIVESHRHYFVADIGTPKGAEVMASVRTSPATPKDIAAADQLVADAAGKMGRALDTRGIKELLYQNIEHPRWDNVAGRCLACANCTMVCPTCFCNTIEDTTNVSGNQAERWRRWDSCFTLEFSYVYGGSVRSTTRSRYRQWLTHKLASWHDQFGSSGCVGCGRCITWCPVGIDITEEARAIRAGSVGHVHKG